MGAGASPREEEEFVHVGDAPIDEFSTVLNDAKVAGSVDSVV